MQQMETLPAGTMLHGRYRVERNLGSGGFGHVYLSVDLQTNTQYAIKEYLVTGANGKVQLEHETSVLSHLHHPNLPALLAAFDENGRYYVVLGYIEGNDLTDYLRVVRQKNEPLPIARLMEWLLSVCDAVAFLHSQRPPIIHRDIKPDNIRITPSGTAILVDLGNAKTAADGARTLFFIRHQGTPGYAPLEQYPGGSGTDERSDVYALGGTLYFALTAHEPPSVSQRNQALQQKQPDLPTLAERLAHNPPENQQEPRQFRLGVSKPSKPVPRHSRHLAQLGTLPPELLRKLDAVIQRAMAMKPQDRYQTVTEFSNDLKLVLRVLPAATLPRRPVDPHSTQPDLPMLYEEIQNQKASAQAQAGQRSPSAQSAPANPQGSAQAQAGQRASAQSTPANPQGSAQAQAGQRASAQSAPANPQGSAQAQAGQRSPGAPAPVSQPKTPIPAAALHCPNCQSELNRPAPYCPYCGIPLNPPPPPRGQAHDPGQQAGGRSPQQNIADEATMLIPPGPQPQGPAAGQARQAGTPSAQVVLPRKSTNGNLPTLRATRQQTLTTSSQAVPAVRPEQDLAAARKGTSTNPPQPRASSASQQNTYAAVKPFMPTTSDPNHGAIQTPIGQTPSASINAHSGTGLARKLAISVAIFVVALIIVTLLLLAFMRSNHIIGSSHPAHEALALADTLLARLASR